MANYLKNLDDFLRQHSKKSNDFLVAFCDAIAPNGDHVLFSPLPDEILMLRGDYNFEQYWTVILYNIYTNLKALVPIDLLRSVWKGYEFLLKASKSTDDNSVEISRLLTCLLVHSSKYDVSEERNNKHGVLQSVLNRF